MGNWTDLKNAVDAVIKTNGNNEITGNVLQLVLNSIVDNIGGNCPFVDIATPLTNPGTPDGKLFYMAFDKGIYPNFNGYEVTKDVAYFIWSGTGWTFKEIQFNNSDIANGGGNGVSASIIQISNKSTDFTFDIPTYSWVDYIFFTNLTGVPTVKVGTAAGLDDIVPESVISGIVKFAIDQPFIPITTLYVSVSGGSVNVRIDLRSNMFVNTLDPFNPVSTFTKTEINNLLLDKADNTDVLLLSGVTQSLVPASIQDVNDAINDFNDNAGFLHTDDPVINNRPASLGDIGGLDLSGKADTDNVLLLDGATLDLQPASKADVGLSLLWVGSISALGVVTKLGGTKTVSSVIVSGDGIYAFTHDIGDTDYIVAPGLGTSNSNSSPRSCFNPTDTSFSVRVSSDNTSHSAPFQLFIWKIL